MQPLVSSYSDSLWEEYADIDVCEVAVDIDAPNIEPTYTYRIPESLGGSLGVGLCVHIPFAGREALGYVLRRYRLPLSDPLAPRLKSIIAIVEDAVTIDAEQLHLVRWMCDRYLCDLLSALRCVAPATLGARVVATVRLSDPDLRGSDLGDSIPQAHIVEILRSLDGRAEVQDLVSSANIAGFSAAYSALLKRGLLVESRAVARAKTVAIKQKLYSLGSPSGVLPTGRSRGARPSPQQQRILNALRDRARQDTAPCPAAELLTEAQASAASLRGLVANGLVNCAEALFRRSPIVPGGIANPEPSLTAGQTKAVETLETCTDAGGFRTVVLFGVTASGKTEVYLRAIRKVLDAGRSAIVLVPEIGLTAQTVDVFTGRFGGKVAVLHSKLSDGERHDEWKRIQRGEAKIVVGARSAIFAPLSNVGLIVVDEEHEASYKQENNPRYDARELAAERARRCGATLVLGSATPSVETYYASEPHEGEVVAGADAVERPIRIEMSSRIDDRPLPRVEVVDLREEFKQRRALFSSRLCDAMARRLSAKQQTILFLNRRGYAQFVLCRDCGYVARCPHCAVSLAFHVYDRNLRCHHCEYSVPSPQVCPDCGSAKVKAFGIGTEKVEEEVARLFPSARVARMDRDTTARKGEHTRLVREFRAGEADVLIGTQMVAKGLDFPNVTLVGVISADTSINLPDFRAAERTFQLLTQVAGRAGRGVNPGEVIVQTFSPDHFAIQAAMRQHFEEFYEQEIVFRQELKYPPFSRLANLVCADPVESAAEGRADRLASALESSVPNDVEVIGPAPAPLARLKNHFRFHVAIRSPVDAPIADYIRSALAQLTAADRIAVSVDIDPLSMA